MVDINLLTEHYPSISDFRASDLIAFRGDVLSYWANIDKPNVSTDAQGFRHTMLDGKKFSLVECTQSPRWGIVLGPSTIFGSGLTGNENTMPSLLSERFGFPFANGAMPGANTRNINSLLVGLLAAAKQPPSVVVLSNGGDLATFCNTGFADPIFGSPNRVQVKAMREAGIESDFDAAFTKLLVFTRLWVSVTTNLCRSRKIPLVLVHQSTFFEKTKPTALERKFKIGEPVRQSQHQLFAKFRRFDERFFAHRKDLAKELGVPIAGTGLTDRLTFIDEFHLDVDGLKLLSGAVGDEIEPLLGGSKPKSAKKKAAAG